MKSPYTEENYDHAREQLSALEDGWMQIMALLAGINGVRCPIRKLDESELLKGQQAVTESYDEMFYKVKKECEEIVKSYGGELEDAHEAAYKR